jgi:hypothetical protein
MPKTGAMEIRNALSALIGDHELECQPALT